MASISRKVTISAVEKLSEGKTIRDTEIKGFGVRKRSGSPKYFLQTRIKGRLRWLTIGTHGSPWNPATARKEALRLLSEIAVGEDPCLERTKKRSIPTIKEASIEFMENHGPRISERTCIDYKRLLKDYINPKLGKYKIDELDRLVVSKAHISWKKTPRSANHALAVLSKFMSWAEEAGLRQEQTNPCRGIKRFREVKRERYLSSDEFEKLGNALNLAEQNKTENLFVIAAIRLLILTGARLSEILTLTWEEVDLERNMLFLKHSKTGQKAVFLNEPAKDILLTLPRVQNNPYVIVGNNKADYYKNLQRPWYRIRESAGLTNLRLHDLRHSYASLAAASGASLPLIGKLLGHSQPQTTARYAHLAHDPIRDVNEQVGATLEEVLELKKTVK